MIHLKINTGKKEVPFGNPPFSRVPMLNFEGVRFSFCKSDSDLSIPPKKNIAIEGMYLCHMSSDSIARPCKNTCKTH